MKKLYLSLALLLGLAGTTPAAAQTQETVVTSQGEVVTELTKLSELATSGTPVMLYNVSREHFLENHPYDDGTHKLLVGYDFVANSTGNKSFLWKLVAVEGEENTYRLLSLEDNKYLYMSQRQSANPYYPTTTVSQESQDSIDSYVVEASAYTSDDAIYANTFYLASTNAGEYNERPVCLNGNDYKSAGPDRATVVGWQKGDGGKTTIGDNGDNSAYRIFIPTTTTKPMYTVTFDLKFFDGTTNTNIAEDEALSDLLPTEATTYTTKAAIGDTVNAPTYANNQIRNLTNGSTVVSDSGSFKLTAEMVANGSYTLTASYSSDPRITFRSTIDASLVGGDDGYYTFDDGTFEMDNPVRVTTGDSIVAPRLSRFTAVSDIKDIADKSKTIDVVYRPWRAVALICQYKGADGGLEDIKTVNTYVDLDSLITPPDLGSLYTYNDELTYEEGYNMEPTHFPLKVTLESVSYDGQEFYFIYDVNAPVKTTNVSDDGTVPEDATWYILRLRGSKVLTDGVNEGGMLVLSASATIDDHALWCLRQNEGDGTYFLYNKANPNMVLCDLGSGYPELTQATGAEQGFEMIAITTGYGFRVPDTENVWNDLSGAGQLGYWANAGALSDVGSTLTFEEYKAANYTFLDGRGALNAENCINGYTAEQLSEIAEFIEEGDTENESVVTEIVGELMDLPAEDLIQYNAEHGYAIVSAAPEFISRNNVKYALYYNAASDTVLTWREFNPYDKNFYFELGNRKDLVSTATGEADSTVYSLKHIGSGKYVDAAKWAFLKPLYMTEEYNDTTMQFHVLPVTEVWNADETAITRSAIPAAFYIDRLWYSDNDPAKSKVVCTMSMFAGAISNATTGNIVSYNTHSNGIANVFRFWDGGAIATVGIDSVTNDEEATGAENGAIYDLSGRRVQKAEKGIYIQDGKKIYVK